MTTDARFAAALGEHGSRQVLFAISSNDRENAGLTTREAILGVGDLAAAAARGTYLFAHWLDTDAAYEWLRDARRYSWAEIDAWAPEPATVDAATRQHDEVMRVWRAWGMFWRAMNVSPYGWAKFRERLEVAWGAPPPVSGGTPNPRNYRGIDVSGENPCGQNGNVAERGSWRRAIAATANQYGPDTHNGAWDACQVLFGTVREWNEDSIGCMSGVGCPGPTGEVHRVWMQRDGTLAGGTEWKPAELARELRATALQFDANSIPGGLRDRGAMRWTWQHRLTRVCSITSRYGQACKDRIYALAPMDWYWRLLREPVAGLKVAGVGDDVSLIDYLLATPAEAILREIARDVVVRNRQMANVHGVSDSRLPGAALREYADRQADAARTSQEIQLVATAASTALGRLGPVATLVGGAASLVTSIVAPLVTPAPEKPIDVLGRLMPAFEEFAIFPDRDTFELARRAMGFPDGRSVEAWDAAVNARRAELTAMIDPGAGVVTPTIDLGNGPTNASLRIVGMPPYGVVTVDGTDVTASGHWEEESDGVYVVTVSQGTHAVHVAPEDASWMEDGTVTVTGTGGTFNARPDITATVALLGAPDRSWSFALEGASGLRTPLVGVPPMAEGLVPGLYTLDASAAGGGGFTTPVGLAAGPLTLVFDEARALGVAKPTPRRAWPWIALGVAALGGAAWATHRSE